MSQVPQIKIYGFDFIGPLRLTMPIVQMFPVNSFGVYCLGTRSNRRFTPGYFGRSDTCVQTRLLSHVRAKQFTHFCIRILDTLWEAYSLECKLVHAFASAFPLANIDHPAKPTGKSWPCPVCGQ